MASGPIMSWQIDGETMETVTDFIFLGSKITADGNRSHKIKSHLFLGRKAMTNPDSILKSRDNYFADKGLFSESYSFSSSHVCMWELDYKESWTLKNWCFQIWCWRRLLRVPWTLKQIHPANPKLNQSWLFFGRTDAEAETPILWPSDE